MEAVKAALDLMQVQVSQLDDEFRGRLPNRSISAHILDHDVVYIGRLEAGFLVDLQEVATAEGKDAAYRLASTSDDFIELVAGRLSFTSAWASGRVRVNASFRDLFELRRLL